MKVEGGRMNRFHPSSFRLHPSAFILVSRDPTKNPMSFVTPGF
jgi:hypothetical protein